MREIVPGAKPINNCDLNTNIRSNTCCPMRGWAAASFNLCPNIHNISWNGTPMKVLRALEDGKV